MNIERIHTLLAQPSELIASDESLLNDAIKKWPYFQGLYALKLKLLANTNSFRFNYFLRQTATRTTNRKLLFDFITSAEFKQQKTVAQIQENLDKLNQLSELEKTLGISKEEAKVLENPDLFEKKNHLEFTSQDKHSFNEWLSFLKIEPVKAKKSSESKTLKNPKVKKQQEIIDSFISENPKIKPAKSNLTTESIVELSSKPSQLMTETLANVYLEQKRYNKAIQAFKILILNNPEKSSLFANRIKEIEKLKENK